MLAALRPRDPRYSALVLDGPLAQIAGIDARLSYIVCCWAVLSPVARYRMAQEKKIQRFLDAHRAFFGDEAAMAELHKFVGEPHMFVTKDPASANSLKALAMIEDFIRRRG